MRTLVETGVLVGERGAYRLAQPLDTLQIPATVQALLAARIDRLPPEDKRLLQTAAVIGTEVPWPLLQAIADTPDEALYRSLTQLQAAEFLYETSLFPERAYTFKHALTHEVAYGSLLHERRRVLHARIVEALEALAGDRWTTRWNGSRSMPCGARCGRRPWPMAARRGTKPRTRSAYREAVVCYEQALVALEHLPDSHAATGQAIDLRLGLHGAFTALGEALGGCSTICAAPRPSPRRWATSCGSGQVYAAMSVNCWVAGDVDRAIVSGQRTLAVATTLGHVGLQARGHFNLGRVYYDMGDYPRAIESLEQNVVTLQGDLLYERFGSQNIVAATSRAWLGLCHAERGAFTEGLAMAEEGLRIAETVNSPFSLIEVCSGVSLVYQRQGDVQRAIAVLERAMGLCQDWHIPLFVPQLAAALGLAYILEGRVTAGLALVEQGVEQEVARGRSRRLALMVTGLSEAYLLAGRLEDAHQRAAQALDLARQYQQRGTQAWALWLLGESTAHQASPEGEPAAGHYRQALTLAEELGMRPLQAHCHRGLGTLYATTGQRNRPVPRCRQPARCIEIWR